MQPSENDRSERGLIFLLLVVLTGLAGAAAYEHFGPRHAIRLDHSGLKIVSAR